MIPHGDLYRSPSAVRLVESRRLWKDWTFGWDGETKNA
jgi:hypothetical protein